MGERDFLEKKLSDMDDSMKRPMTEEEKIEWEEKEAKSRERSDALNEMGVKPRAKRGTPEYETYIDMERYRIDNGERMPMEKIREKLEENRKNADVIRKQYEL